MTIIYRADQVGSLIRPAYLLDARAAFKQGTVSAGQLAEAEDEAVLDAIAVQRAAGMGLYSDGEMRRDAYATVFSQAVDGFEPDYREIEFTADDGTKLKRQVHIKAVSGKLSQARRLAQVDAAFLEAHAPGPFKITLPSACYLTPKAYRDGITDKVYADRKALRQDIAAIIGDEIEALADDGASYVQLDEGFIDYVRPAHLDGLRQQGLDPETVLEEDVAVDNGCYARARARGLTTAMHLCQGSRTKIGRPTQSFEWLAERLFDKLDVDCFLLEYDAERIRGFEPLRHLPRGKVAVLGLISSKEGALEIEDDIMRRIEEAARYCPAEQLAISTQCGFSGSGTADGAHMTMDEQARKLELVCRVAQRVWGTTGAVDIA